MSHSYFLSHTLMGSIYLCYVDFSLVVFGNGVMTNDWWCRDKTESLLWARTHGWAARHALVLWLIVVIHYGTILSVIFVDILSKCSLHFIPIMSRCPVKIYLHYLVRYPLMKLHLSSAWELHASPPLRVSFKYRDNILLRGEGCDTPGVYFVLCREIYPNLGCSVKISISRSCLSLFIRISLGSSPNSELFDREKQPILERVKTFISRNECKLDDQSRFINLV
jgi:hypothetical protein